MKVIHLTSVHPWDDTRIFLKMCRAVAMAGHEVHLVAPRADRPAGTSEAVDGVRIHAIAPVRSRRDRMFRAAGEALSTGLALNGDLYHFHDPEFLRIAPQAQLRSGKPFIYDVHEDYREGTLEKAWIPRPLRRPLAWWSARTEDRKAPRLAGVVCATPHIARHFTGHPGLAVVQNFPWREELAPLPRQAGGSRSRFAYVGGVSRLRGAHEMVAAMSRAPEGAELVIAGAWEDQSLRDACADDPGWQRCVAANVLDRRAVQELLSGAAAGLVCFLPARNHCQAQPNKLFEYMSAGIPVIASDFPLWRKIVTDTGCGLLVDPSSPEAIAEAMRRIIADPVAAQAMGERGRQAVLGHFSWESEFPILLRLYERLVRAP